MNLRTCNECEKKDWCVYCSERANCFWLSLAPPTPRQIACASFNCADYKGCKKEKPEDRVTWVTPRGLELDFERTKKRGNERG